MACLEFKKIQLKFYNSNVLVHSRLTIEREFSMCLNRLILFSDLLKWWHDGFQIRQRWMDVQLEDVRVGARRWLSIRRKRNDRELIERDVGIRSGAARVCTNVGHVSVVVTATTLDSAAVTITDSAAAAVALAGISLNRPRRRHRGRCVLPGI